MTAETSNARGWDGTPTWRKQKPTRAGVYGVRGFNFGVPASEQFEAIVAVRLYNDELICNLHISTSEDDFDDWLLVEDCNDEFEWCEFAATPPPPADARGDVRIIARDIHYAIMDDGLAPLSNADNHKVREAILRVLEAALAAEGVQAGEVDERVPALTTLRFLPGGIVQMDNADFEKLRIAAALSQQPEPKAEARGVVDEAMVERAGEAWQGMEDGRVTKETMRCLLTAALTESRNGR